MPKYDSTEMEPVETVYFQGFECSDIKIYFTSSNNAENTLSRIHLGSKTKIFSLPNGEMYL